MSGLSGRELIPALITLMALGCGLGAIEASHLGNWDLALRLILLAAIIDGVDGTVARKLNAAGPWGGQLDSLSDIVAFGVAPAFLFASAYPDAYAPVRLAMALAFVAAGAFRLARFHILPSSAYFYGLPIPSAGVLLAASVAGPFDLPVWVAGGISVALAALMVSMHPFPTFAQWRKTLLGVLAGSAVLIAIWPSDRSLAIIAVVVLVSYVLWGFVTHLVDGTETADGPASFEAETHA
jgi:CDP-diacylglycerol---serine O-phosphatidyltransferase